MKKLLLFLLPIFIISCKKSSTALISCKIVSMYDSQVSSGTKYIYDRTFTYDDHDRISSIISLQHGVLDTSKLYRGVFYNYLPGLVVVTDKMQTVSNPLDSTTTIDTIIVGTNGLPLSAIIWMNNMRWYSIQYNYDTKDHIQSMIGTPLYISPSVQDTTIFTWTGNNVTKVNKVTYTFGTKPYVNGDIIYIGQMLTWYVPYYKDEDLPDPSGSWLIQYSFDKNGNISEIVEPPTPGPSIFSRNIKYTYSCK